MDPVGKRIVFFQALAVLQVAKIYQWFVHPWTWEAVGLWQWLLVDVLVLLYASRSGIKFPSSTPNRNIFLGLFVLLFLLNAILAHSAVWSSFVFFFPSSSHPNGRSFSSSSALSLRFQGSTFLANMLGISVVSPRGGTKTQRKPFFTEHDGLHTHVAIA